MNVGRHVTGLPRGVVFPVLPRGLHHTISAGVPGPEFIKLFSCSTQLSVKYFLLINVKMLTVVGILTFMSGKSSILGLSEPKKSPIFIYFYTYERLKLLEHEKSFITWGLENIY